MTLQLGWGWKIAFLYSAFVVMMLWLVISSSRQKFDLVSTDYYKDEIAYQHVLDASKNQAALTGALVIRANEQIVSITFPGEFSGKIIKGTVNFYSAVSKDWDRSVVLNAANNEVSIDRGLLRKTNYTLKLSYSVDGKNYYQENDINLSK